MNTGMPASEVKITLSKKSKGDTRTTIDEKLTDTNGRIKDFLKQDGRDTSGIYKLTFHTTVLCLAWAKIVLPVY